MPVTDQSSIDSELSKHEIRITGLEHTLDIIVKPLIKKLEEGNAVTQELILTLNNLCNEMNNCTKEVERITRRVDKSEDRHTELREEVVSNRMLVKLVKGLGVKIFWFSLVIAGAAFSIIFATKIAT